MFQGFVAHNQGFSSNFNDLSHLQSLLKQSEDSLRYQVMEFKDKFWGFKLFEIAFKATPIARLFLELGVFDKVMGSIEVVTFVGGIFFPKFVKRIENVSFVQDTIIMRKFKGFTIHPDIRTSFFCYQLSLILRFLCGIYLPLMTFYSKVLVIVAAFAVEDNIKQKVYTQEGKISRLYGWGTHESPKRVFDAVLFTNEVTEISSSLLNHDSLMGLLLEGKGKTRLLRRRISGLLWISRIEVQLLSFNAGG
ncbi:hypothetical protein GIB67_015831 [Kingdonia uniflora]|uniref:Uncharacterized protein n=1 Tax=Kingdonia uniflora TaxID=39325 RepID=A0A7J7NF63_9MAGN|nr:hypothetical protein GIB67_015831 [Kingdonia uniflora]